MIEESEYCSDVMRKHFNKDFAMNKEDDEYFENSIIKILGTPLSVGSMIMLRLMAMLK